MKARAGFGVLGMYIHIYIYVPLPCRRRSGPPTSRRTQPWKAGGSDKDQTQRERERNRIYIYIYVYIYIYPEHPLLIRINIFDQKSIDIDFEGLY